MTANHRPLAAAVPWWARENVWKKSAVWITAVMAVILLLLTFDTLPKISAGGENVPFYAVINQRIYYRFDPSRNVQAPVVGAEAPLFGEKLSEAESKAMVSYGKKIVQGRNCMNCHTLLGNGAYFAPDLTKSWLDPAWGVEETREAMMLAFLQDPVVNRRGGGIGRTMPDMDISEDEARAIVAFLKWMAAIDTNGFPYNFRPIAQRGDK